MLNSEKYQRHIDGLRAIAVLSVVFFHYGQSAFGGGFVGVDVFFVISGYLISNLILHEISETSDFNFRRFYIRRIRRLFPALVVTLVSSLVFAVVLFSPEQLQNYGRSLAAAVFSVSNFLFWQESGYFDPHTHLRPLLHTWSLAVEEQFYLLWPALLWFFTRQSDSRRRFAVLAIVGIVSIALNGIWVNGNFDAKAMSTIFYLTPFRMFELAIGGMAVFSTQVLPTRPWVHELTMAVGLVLIAYAVFGYTDEMAFPYLLALTPCIGALLVIVSREARFVGRILTNRLAVGVGLISYSLYLVHWPVLVFYKHYNYEPLKQAEYLALFILSAMLSVLMYFYVEKPFRKNAPTHSSGGKQKVFVYSSVGAMIFIGIIGFQIGNSDGNIWRNVNALSAEDISRAARDRYTLTRSGCNLLRLDKSKYCKMKRSRQILVIGNSHEPDGFNIFSQVYRNNKNVNLIAFGTLNSCELTLEQDIPVSEVKHNNCTTRTAMLSEKEFLSTLDGVVFSSNQPFDEKHEAAWGALEYIKSVRPNIPIVVLGGYINTTRKCSDLYHRFGSFSACREPLHISYNPFNEREASDADKHRNLEYLYIDKTRLLCENETLESCAITVGNEPAFYDWHHLSMAFSQHLGRRIAEEYHRDLRLRGFPAVISKNPERKSVKQLKSEQKSQ